MSTLVMSACWQLQMPPTPKAVLISLADNANDQGDCWPSIATICDRTCFSERAVQSAIHWLEAHSALIANRDNGRHTKYRITPASYTGEVAGEFHYVYRITHEPSGSFYVGLRTSPRKPDADDYFGSGHWSGWLTERRDECRKEVLAVYQTRESAAVGESAIIKASIDLPGSLNRKNSNPNNPGGNRTPQQMHPAANAPRTSDTPQMAPKPPQLPRQPPQEVPSNRKEPSLRATTKIDTTDFSTWPSVPSEQILADWIALRKRKRAHNSKTAMSRIGAELRKALAFGMTVDDCIGEAVARNWQGFKADWMHPNGGNGHVGPGQPRLSAHERVIANNRAAEERERLESQER